MFGSMLGGMTKTLDSLVSNPVAGVVNITVQPVVDTLSVLQGLSEGEVRVLAATRLGTGYVADMAIDEVILALKES